MAVAAAKPGNDAWRLRTVAKPGRGGCGSQARLWRVALGALCVFLLLPRSIKGTSVPFFICVLVLLRFFSRYVLVAFLIVTTFALFDTLSLGGSYGTVATFVFDLKRLI